MYSLIPYNSHHPMSASLEIFGYNQTRPLSLVSTDMAEVLLNL